MGMRSGANVIEGWPALLSTEMASRYLSIDERTLLQLAERHHAPAVYVDGATMRWRRQDLGHLIKKLPTMKYRRPSDHSVHLVRLEVAHIEAIANAISERLERGASFSGRKLVSIREARKILGLGRSSIYRMIEDGRLTTKRIGRRNLVHMDTINAILGSG